MSGGSLDYGYYNVHILADEIDRKFADDNAMLDDVDAKSKKEILREVESLCRLLRNCGDRARNLEWFLSGDIGVDTYIKRIRE